VLSPAEPSATEVGRLRFRAGFHLTADRGDFGGFSGLVVAADGGWLVAVSDRGHWLRAELRHASDGTLIGLGPARLGPLPDADGRPVRGRRRRDAEDLVMLPGQGLVVSFEGDHRMALYDAHGEVPVPGGPPRDVPPPPGIAAMDPNGGMEAVTRLADGRLLVLSEDLRTEQGLVVGWVGTIDGGGWERLTLVPTETFRPTSATTLGSGDVLLLERSFQKEADVVRARLSLLPAADLVPGAELRSRELARLVRPQTVDNMEAVAVRSGPDGETLIYALSDDNFSADQRTLLLQFELLADPNPPGGSHE
jgi:hypothetical protein